MNKENLRTRRRNELIRIFFGANVKLKEGDFVDFEQRFDLLLTQAVDTLAPLHKEPMRQFYFDVAKRTAKMAQGIFHGRYALLAVMNRPGYPVLKDFRELCVEQK